jgi:hypothetical protein
MLVCHAKSSFLCRTTAARLLTLDATGMVHGSLRSIVGPTEFLVATTHGNNNSPATGTTCIRRLRKLTLTFNCTPAGISA